MILICPACQTRYQTDAAKFPPQGRNVRCARCGEVWHQAAPELVPEAVPDPVPEPQPEYVAPPPEEPRAEYYAQPQVREPEPQPEEEYDHPAPRTPSQWPRRLALGTGWLLLAGIVLAVVAGMAIWRLQVVQVWPQSASLYAAFGVKVNATGLTLNNIKYTQEPQGGRTVLTVTGALTNVTNRELPVPQIRVGLTNGDRRELYHWTFAPDVMTLRPGQTTHFVTRLSSPPEGARNLEVRFAKAGE
jgi:predicted Zn finger-like uncharacterized protein